MKESLGNTGGGKVAFKSFFGKVPVDILRNAMNEYKSTINNMFKELSGGNDASQAINSISLVGNLSRAVDAAQAIIKPIEIPIAKTGFNVSSVSSSLVRGITYAVASAKSAFGALAAAIPVGAVTAGLDAISLKVGTWAKVDFPAALELGQTARAISSEAEAAFSKEATGRKIFNALFSSNKVSGLVGYHVGLYTNAIVGGLQILTDSILKIPQGTLGLLGKITDDTTSASILKIKSSIGIIITPIRAAFAGFFTIVSKIINKYTFSVLTSVFVASNMLFMKIGQKIAQGINALSKKISSLFKSIMGGFFKNFGLGGGGGGALGELSGFQIFSVAAIGASTKMAANLEEAMLRVTTITLQTGAALKNVTAQVVGLSNEFGKSATDVSSSLYDISSAGFQGADALAILRASIQAASAGMTSTSVSSTAISRALRAFNLPVESATTVSDVLFNVVKRGITTFDGLAQQITRVLTVSNVSGVSLQELGAVLAFLTRNGLQTEQAILGVQGLLKSLISPAEEAKEAAKQIGLAWDETTLKQKGFIKLLQESAPKILANKDVFKKLVGEMQGVTAALSIASKPFELTEDLAAMNERGAAAEAAAQVALGFNYQMEKFWTNFVNILRNIGQVVLPYVQPLLEMSTEMIAKLAEFANKDFSGFWAGIKAQIGMVSSSLLQMIGETSRYIGEELVSVGAKILPYVTGLTNALGGLLYSVVVDVGPKIFTFLIKQFWMRLQWLWALIKFSIRSIDAILQNELGAVYSSIKHFLVVLAAPFIGIYKVVAAAGRAVSYLISLIPGFGGDDEQKVEKPPALAEAQRDYTKWIKDFQTDFNKGFESFKFDFKKNDKLADDVSKSFESFNGTIAKAATNILNTSSQALQDQAESMNQVLLSLEAQYKKEVAAGQKERAEITLKFIEKQKTQIGKLADDLQNSELGDALKKQQELYLALARARRDGEKILQISLIESIKDNELFIMKMEAAARNKAVQANQQVVNQQVNMFDLLKNKSLELIKAGEKLGSGLGNLNQVLDDVFGKNVERIAKQYGVGQDIADSRELARDVIEARAAGFAVNDINTIVTRGLMQRSSALTSVLTAFKKYQRSLSIEDVTKLGLSGEIIRLLDQAEALGLDAIGRKALLQSSLTEEAFKFLDQQLSGDKTVKFVEMANKHFEGISEERRLQERFNEAQLKVADLTKTAVTRNQKLKVLVDELEKKVAELEQLQNQQGAIMAQNP
ncbi:MAG: phage tail tape measure protein [Candidatus Brocadiae bacterium]|nr:phage tail tape measure protein [Candidatus Brocadiia bacterium]